MITWLIEFAAFVRVPWADRLCSPILEVCTPQLLQLPAGAAVQLVRAATTAPVCVRIQILESIRYANHGGAAPSKSLPWRKAQPRRHNRHRDREQLTARIAFRTAPFSSSTRPKAARAYAPSTARRTFPSYRQLGRHLRLVGDQVEPGTTRGARRYGNPREWHYRFHERLGSQAGHTATGRAAVCGGEAVT